jgi:hypothetical protein
MRAEPRRHARGMPRLVEIAVFEPDRKRLHRHTVRPCGEVGNRRGVDATAQEDADRDI